MSYDSDLMSGSMIDILRSPGKKKNSLFVRIQRAVQSTSQLNTRWATIGCSLVNICFTILLLTISDHLSPASAACPEFDVALMSMAVCACCGGTLDSATRDRTQVLIKITLGFAVVEFPAK